MNGNPPDGEPEASNIESRIAWQRLYSQHGIQYGGTSDLGPLESLLKPGMVVLDLGCGDGKTAERLAAKCEVVACDFSHEALISFATQRTNIDSVNLVECDMKSLPFEQERFNAITLVHSVSHLVLREREQVAGEAYRVARPGGIVFVEVFSTDDIRAGEGKPVEDMTFLRGNGVLTHYFRKGEVQGLFDRFLVLSEMELTRRVTYGSVTGKRHVIRVILKRNDGGRVKDSAV